MVFVSLLNGVLVCRGRGLGGCEFSGPMICLGVCRNRNNRHSNHDGRCKPQCFYVMTGVIRVARLITYLGLETSLRLCSFSADIRPRVSQGSNLDGFRISLVPKKSMHGALITRRLKHAQGESRKNSQHTNESHELGTTFQSKCDVDLLTGRISIVRHVDSHHQMYSLTVET